MKARNFSKLVQDRFDYCIGVLKKKEKEYSSNKDRFQNFADMAIADQISKEQALWGTFLKHFISVRGMVKDQKIYSEEYIAEKISDSINLLCILEGILSERNEELKKEEEALSK